MKRIKLIPLFLLVFVLSSCGASSSEENFMDMQNNFTTATDTQKEEMPVSDEASTEQAGEDRKIIKNYNTYAESKDYDKAKEDINTLIKEFDGYIVWSNESLYDLREYSVDANIPSEMAEDFLKKLEETESIHINQKDQSMNDITDQYKDVDLRLESLNNRLDRLYEMQDEDMDMESFLALDREINQTIEEIEELKKDKTNLDKDIDYSSCYISLSEVGVGKDDKGLEADFSERVKEAFSSTFSNFTRGLKNFIIFLIYALPFILLILVIALIIRAIAKANKKKKTKKSTKEEKKISPADNKTKAEGEEDK